MDTLLLKFIFVNIFVDVLFCLHIPLVVHRREDIAEVTVDTLAKGVAFTRPFLSVPEKTPAAVIAIYVNKSTLFVHDWSGSTTTDRRKDEVQVVKTKKIQSFVSYISRGRISALDETVTSLAVDWITDKLYFGIEVPVTQTNVGRIEVCSLSNEKLCTIVLSSTADVSKPKVESLHFLVLDPTKGRMYWLNSLNKWIESAWMDGRYHVVNMFNQSLGDNVVTTGLTLDQASRSLYYLKIDSTSHETGLWSCRLLIPYSCHFVTSLGSGHYLGIFKDHILWTSLSPQLLGSSLTVCEKIDCANGSFIRIANSEGFGAFLVNDSFIQPPRSLPNPCSNRNGGCSHFCALTPESPWHSCLCPIGLKLLNDEVTCAEKLTRVLFVATSSGMLYISLDTSHHIPMPIPLLEHIDVTYVDYDPIEKKLYFVERDSKNIMSCEMDGSNLEVFIGNLKIEPESIAVDWLNRNLYWLDTKGGQIKIQSLITKQSRVIFADGKHNFQSLAIDPDLGFLYFADIVIKENRFSIVRAWLDGSNQKTLISLDYEPSGIAVDGVSNTIYWSDNERVLLRSAFLNNGSFKDTFNKSDNRPASMSKLGDFLYYITLFGRQIYMLNLTQNGTEPSGEKIDFMNGMMIYSLQNIRAVDFDHRPEGTSLCSIKNGGCSHICIKLPGGEKQCLCREGYELLTDGVTCHLPDAFLIYRQTSSPNALMRISLDSKLSTKSRIHIEDEKTAFESISLDYGNEKLFWSTSGQVPHFSFLYSAHYNGTGLKLVLASESLKDIAIDWVTGNIYWCNVVQQRIEVAKQDGSAKRTIVWKNVVPRYLVVHSKYQFIAFINNFGGQSSIHKLSLSGNRNGDAGIALYSSSGILSELMVDYYYDRFVWYSKNGTAGQLFSMDFDGNNIIKWVDTNTFAPVSLSVYKGRVYFANAGSSAIELFDNGKFSVVHRDIPKILWLSVAYHDNFTDGNDCIFANGRCPELCFPRGKRAECLCENHNTYDKKSKTCLNPNQFVFLSSENHLLRINLRMENDTKVIEEPFSVLPISDVGAPKAIDFDMFSSKRFVYWIDAWQDDGLKRASDVYKVTSGKGLNEAQVVNVTRDLSCSNLSSLAIDNYGRQLYVSCAETSVERGSSIHVFRIKSDDLLVYIGCVVNGKTPSMLIGHRPFPQRIALFPNLNMLFYIDFGGWEPRLVRCTLDGQTCILWNTTGLANSSRLHAFHNAEDRIFFTTNNGFHWHPAIDYSLNHRPHLYVYNVQDIIPVSVEKVLMLKRAGDNSLLLEYPLVEKHVFSEAEIVMPVILAISDVFENDGSMKSSYTCEKSSCSHLCIVHRGKAVEDRFECLCPLEHYKRENNCSKTVACESWQFTCQNGQHCVHYSSFCDEVPECEDYSDEHPKLCKISAFKNMQWPCLNGEKSIQKHQFCDGKEDCSDGSDEAHCRCSNPFDEFDCRSRLTNTFYCVKRDKLCSELQNCSNMNDIDRKNCKWNDDKIQSQSSSLSFEFAVPFLIFFVVLCIAISICCCHLAARRAVSSRCTSHPIHFNGSGAEAHVLLPATTAGTQFEFQLRTFSTGGDSAVYNTVPSFSIPPPRSEASGQPVLSANIHSVSSSVQASLLQEHDFIAPPPSAASLSTYGVVKPAGMKLYVDNRPGALSSLKRSRRRTRRRRNGTHKQRTPPPPYSQGQSNSRRGKRLGLRTHGDDGHRAPTNTRVVDSSESSTAEESPVERDLKLCSYSSSSSSLDT